MRRQGVGARHIQIPPGWLTVATPRSSAAPSGDWWLSGGIDSANAIAVYQPIGADDLADSYINLANPSTYDASVPSGKDAPTWDVTNGWTGNGSSMCLTTGLTSFTSGWSAFCRFSGAVSSGGSECAGGKSYAYLFMHWDAVNKQALAPCSTQYATISSYVSSGTMGFSAGDCYFNGSYNSTKTQNSTNSYAFYLLAVNEDWGVRYYTTGSVQAFAIYDTALTSGQMSALDTATLAL